MPSRSCLGCGRPFPIPKLRSGRCPTCARANDAAYRNAQRAAGIPSGGARIPATKRQRVLAKARQRCFYCGAKATAVDHVVPMIRGGRSTDDNLIAACDPCNRAKATQTVAEFLRSDWLRQRRAAQPQGGPIHHQPRSADTGLPLAARKSGVQAPFFREPTTPMTVAGDLTPSEINFNPNND